MDLDKICRAFKRNRFDCTIFETAEEAAAYLSQEIHGKTVGMGDSMTLENMKMYERLSENNEVYDVQHIENRLHIERTDGTISFHGKEMPHDRYLPHIRQRCIGNGRTGKHRRYGKPDFRLPLWTQESVFCYRCE